MTLTRNGREAVGGPLALILSLGSDRACTYAYLRRARTYDMLPDAGCLSGEDIGTFWPVNKWVGIYPCNLPPHSASHVHHMPNSIAEINWLATII